MMVGPLLENLSNFATTPAAQKQNGMIVELRETEGGWCREVKIIGKVGVKEWPGVQIRPPVQPLPRWASTNPVALRD